MKSVLLILSTFLTYQLFANQPIKKNKKELSKNNTIKELIRTNNPDTLYVDLENTIILTPTKNESKKQLEIKPSQGKITKLSNGFYQLSDLKLGQVLITIFDKRTNTIVAEKNFIVEKQVLPF